MIRCVGVAVALVTTATASVQNRAPLAPTAVVHFTVPAEDSTRTAVASGTCSGPSRAAWFRDDAFACSADRKSHDPCFLTARNDVVMCVSDPRSASGRVPLRLTSALPRSETGSRGEHHSWFFELADGTTCRPLQSPGREIEGQIELYECQFGADGPADAVLGELNSSDPIWSIAKVKINKMLVLTIKWSASAAVKTVWQ